MTLSSQHRQQIRLAVLKQLEPRERNDFVSSPGYDVWCETHSSDGRPLVPEYATFRAGLTYCEICDQPTEDSGDLCGACLGMVEPWRDEPVDHHQSIDPHGARL